MAGNHRGFVDTLIAANRIGADVLLLNTSFAGPALAEVMGREGDGKFVAVATLKEFVRANLPNYRVPRSITVLDELPRSITGKIFRMELQERAQNG